MPTINFKTHVINLNSWLIVQLPKDASAKLPSRGIAMVQGTINDRNFKTALEPDGMGSHWFKISDELQRSMKLSEGDALTLKAETTSDWPEPAIPTDISSAIAANKKARETWSKTTPMAHWEWLRWIRSTSRDETRKRRIEVACSKLEKGMRRPCCFNSSMCTEPDVSKNGVLLQPFLTAK